MKNFAIIVDGEVVGNQTYSDEMIEKLNMERTIAIFSSDPRFVPTDLPVDIGATWDGKNFTSPVK